MNPTWIRRLSLNWEACTSCMACVRDCPSWCIEMRAHPEADDSGGRPRRVLVLDVFEIDSGQCIDCGTCVDVCAPKALRWEWNPAGRLG